MCISSWPDSLSLLSNREFISSSFLMPTDSRGIGFCTLPPLVPLWRTLPRHWWFESLPKMGGCSQKVPGAEQKSNHQGFQIYLFLPWEQGFSANSTTHYNKGFLYCQNNCLFLRWLLMKSSYQHCSQKGWRMFCFLSCYLSFPSLEKVRMEWRRGELEPEVKKTINWNVFKGKFSV